MLPTPATHDCSNGYSANTMFRSQRFVAGRRCSTPNVPHSFICQYRAGVVFAFGCAVPAFGVLVRVIVSLSSQEQMHGVDAARVVAAVENVKPVRDRPDHEFVGDTMSELASATPSPGLDNSVVTVHAPGNHAAGPQNAARLSFLADRIPKPILQRNPAFVVEALAGAKPPDLVQASVLLSADLASCGGDKFAPQIAHAQIAHSAAEARVVCLGESIPLHTKSAPARFADQLNSRRFDHRHDRSFLRKEGCVQGRPGGDTLGLPACIV